VGFVPREFVFVSRAHVVRGMGGQGQRRLQCERKRANRMIHELEKLGYQVSPAGA